MRFVVVFALSLFAAGCATSGSGDGPEYRETEYKTGSNLPQKRNRDLPVEEKSVDPAAIPRNASPASRVGG